MEDRCSTPVELREHNNFGVPGGTRTHDLQFSWGQEARTEYFYNI